MINDVAPVALKRWRENLEVSQEWIADKMQTTRTVVCEWERGARRPSLDRAFALETLTGGHVAARMWAQPVKRQIRRA